MNKAQTAIENCDNFNQADNGYYAVPIIWSTSTNAKSEAEGALNICLDKSENAKDAADLFTGLWPILEKSTMPMSFMAHSLGNYVLSMFAQQMGENPKTRNSSQFDDIFMVAPCLRNNIFDANENEGDYTTLTIPDRKYQTQQKNGGLSIANLAKK